MVKFAGNAPASAAEIAQLEGEAKTKLPPGYVAFLLGMNGGEGFVGITYLVLWRSMDIVPRNTAYRVEEFAPGLLLFGSDGAGEAFAFDTRTSDKPILRVPFIGMELASAQFVANDFDSFLKVLSES